MKAGSEQAWQTQVVNLAGLYRWRHFHAPDNRPVRTATGRVMKQAVVPGFPDLILVRAPEIIVAELKTDKGRVSPAQQQWLDDFKGCGIEAYVWRPRDIDDVLNRLARGWTLGAVGTAA